MSTQDKAARIICGALTLNYYGDNYLHNYYGAGHIDQLFKDVQLGFNIKVSHLKVIYSLL